MGYIVLLIIFSGFTFGLMGALERKFRFIEHVIKEMDDGYID